MKTFIIKKVVMQSPLIGWRGIQRAIQEYIEQLDYTRDWVVTIKEHRETRSRAQNAVLHMWMEYISKHVHDGYGKYIPAEHWKHHLVAMLLGTEPIHLGADVEYMRKATSKLNTKEFTYLLESVDMYMGSEYNVQLPHPEDLYRYAMTGEK